ncbi:MAG: hypothetical protein WKF43_03895 [Acidimicrobiales bacterium]
MSADIDFFFDPVCPFAWVTSRWIDRVATLRDLDVEWRFIALRMVNKDRDYERDFPPRYIDGHTRGLELLRVAAAARDAEGSAAVGRLYAAYGAEIWDRRGGLESALRMRGDASSLAPVLAAARLEPDLAAAVDQDRWDEVISAETELALSRTGKDVGTPIVTYGPPDGRSLFGPVISRVPDDAEALELWDAVQTLSRFTGFAELKRSQREPLALESLRRD